MGEGGGQILRTSLALSICLARPFRLQRIRAARQRPGLLRQHLAAVQAAMAVSEAEVHGAELGSQTITFTPRTVKAGRYRFAIGTAGSTTLVLQTVLPALLITATPTELVLEGGTHNPSAPPFDFLVETFLPLLSRMGPRVGARLERPGFYPAGGGVIDVHIQPAARLQPLHLPERGAILDTRAAAVVANLPEHIAQRELAVLATQLGILRDRLELRHAESARGPGNVVTTNVVAEHITETFTGFGERGVPAEAVAQGVASEVRRYLRAGVAVGEHLADQLLLPLALAGGGSFTTLPPSAHTRTNAAVIEIFTATRVSFTELAQGVWQVAVV